MAEKATHFGRAGEFFAMSELLLRGWNVAIPVVVLANLQDERVALPLDERAHLSLGEVAALQEVVRLPLDDLVRSSGPGSAPEPDMPIGALLGVRSLQVAEERVQARFSEQEAPARDGRKVPRREPREPRQSAACE